MRKRVFSAFAVLFFFSVMLFAQAQTPEPYTKDEFHPVLKDLRRAEIITLGAIPFVTFIVTLGYSFSKYASHNFDSNYFPNPFAKSSDANAYTTEEQIGIILTSVGISTGIGLTDFIVHEIKRSRAHKRLKALQTGPIKISPIEEDPEAVKIEVLPQDKNDSSFEKNVQNFRVDDYELNSAGSNTGKN